MSEGRNPPAGPDDSDSTRAASESALKREFREARSVIAVTIFLLIELVLIFAYGSSFYGDGYAGSVDPDGMNQLTWILLSVTGYFLLGLIGSWRLMPVTFLPILFAFAVGIPDGAYADGGEPLPLFFQWIFLMIIYLPAWTAGIAISGLAGRQR